MEAIEIPDISDSDGEVANYRDATSASSRANPVAVNAEVESLRAVSDVLSYCSYLPRLSVYSS
jgi:hypothetical protein